MPSLIFFLFLLLLLTGTTTSSSSSSPSSTPPSPSTPSAPDVSTALPPPTLFVIKRSGKSEPIKFDKITTRLTSLATNLSPQHLDVAKISQKIISGIYAGVTTSELDNLAAETAAYMAADHPDYGTLAARIAISNLHKETSPSFTKTLRKLYTARDAKADRDAGFIDGNVMAFVEKYDELIDNHITHSNDFSLTYFGYKTLERSYLLKSPSGVIWERPQYMLMRVALGLHTSHLNVTTSSKVSLSTGLSRAFETYDAMSGGLFTHASPTLFHAGTTHPQLSSCFLLDVEEDSIGGIYDTLKRCAVISKGAGGIGLSVSNVRARGSYIVGTKGVSNGLVPMLRVFSATSRYVDQGGGKRPGAFAVYLEPWHADVFDFLDLKKNHGKEENRARDLFFGLWINDLFMKRVEANGDWSLMCPNQCPGLPECYGAAFEELYLKYEKAGKAMRTVKARELWSAILDSQVETGTPYMLYKDACNEKSNQNNLGTIKCSNLCTEIVEYTGKDEVAVCNLASVCLPKFVEGGGGKKRVGSPTTGTAAFDFAKLHKIVKVMTRNLNAIIDCNKYPVEAARNSNMKHRPVGLGVSGLADCFIRMGFEFCSDEAKALNKDIFETIYHAAVEASCEIAKDDGVYESYEGSLASKGQLQFDLWGVTPSSRWDWAALKKKVETHGLRNSLLVAPMPTASTSQILGVNECIEPYTSNLYVRRVKAGEFIVVNPHLMQDLSSRGLWNSKVKNQIMKDGGSVQNVKGIPDRLKGLYKTVWEMKMKDLIDMAADRGAFIDQSQSLNLFMAQPTKEKLTAMHFHAWKKGLKTGMYYLRTKAASKAVQFTVEEDKEAEDDEDDEGVCLSCQA